MIIKNSKTITINFSDEEIEELKQFFNTTPIEFDTFLSMILKALLFEMFHKAKDERKRKNNYSFTLDDETNLKLMKIIQKWEKLNNNPLNIDSVIKNLINKEYRSKRLFYDKEIIGGDINE